MQYRIIETIKAYSCKSLVSISMMLATTMAMADNRILPGSEQLHFAGFGSLAETYSDSEQIGFRRELTQEGEYAGWSTLTDSLLGVQLDTYIEDGWRATVQMVAKNRPEYGLNQAVEWAYVTYLPNDDWTFRFGRVAIDNSLIADYGDVSYAYDWVRRPVEFYGFVPIYSFDGLDINHTIRLNNGEWNLKYYLGRTDRVYNGSSFELSPLTGLMAEYCNGNFVYKSSITYTELNDFSLEWIKPLLSAVESDLSHFDPVAWDRLQIESVPVWFLTSGFKYKHERWLWTAEMAYADFSDELILPFFTVYSGASYRLADTLALYGLFSFVETTENVYQVDENSSYRDYAQMALDYYDIDQHTVSLGTRWDVYNNLALKLQWDSIWVAEDKAMLWAKASDTTDAQRVDVFTVSLNFVF